MDIRGVGIGPGKQWQERKHLRAQGGKFAPKGKSEGVIDQEEQMDENGNGSQGINPQQLEQLLMRARKIVKRLEQMLGVEDSQKDVGKGE